MCKKSYFYDFKIQILHYEKTFLIMKMSKNFIVGPPFIFYELYSYKFSGAETSWDPINRSPLYNGKILIHLP